MGVFYVDKTYFLRLGHIILASHPPATISMYIRICDRLCNYTYACFILHTFTQVYNSYIVTFVAGSLINTYKLLQQNNTTASFWKLKSHYPLGNIGILTVSKLHANIYEGLGYLFAEPVTIFLKHAYACVFSYIF